MKIELNKLLSGTGICGEVLHLPAKGGGFYVNEIASAKERYLNMTVTVLEEHSLALEL